MIEAKVANVQAHTGLSEQRARALVTGTVRLSYRAHCCPIRFALVVAERYRAQLEEARRTATFLGQALRSAGFIGIVV